MASKPSAPKAIPTLPPQDHDAAAGPPRFRRVYGKAAGARRPLADAQPAGDARRTDRCLPRLAGIPRSGGGVETAIQQGAVTPHGLRRRTTRSDHLTAGLRAAR